MKDIIQNITAPDRYLLRTTRRIGMLSYTPTRVRFDHRTVVQGLTSDGPNGDPNTGNGGGSNVNHIGGKDGSGIVIIRYLISPNPPEDFGAEVI